MGGGCLFLFYYLLVSFCIKKENDNTFYPQTIWFWKQKQRKNTFAVFESNPSIVFTFACHIEIYYPNCSGFFVFFSFCFFVFVFVLFCVELTIFIFVAYPAMTMCGWQDVNIKFIGQTALGFCCCCCCLFCIKLIVLVFVAYSAMTYVVDKTIKSNDSHFFSCSFFLCCCF